MSDVKYKLHCYNLLLYLRWVVTLRMKSYEFKNVFWECYHSVLMQFIESQDNSLLTSGATVNKKHNDLNMHIICSHVLIT